MYGLFALVFGFPICNSIVCMRVCVCVCPRVSVSMLVFPLFVKVFWRLLILEFLFCCQTVRSLHCFFLFFLLGLSRNCYQKHERFCCQIKQYCELWKKNIHSAKHELKTTKNIEQHQIHKIAQNSLLDLMNKSYKSYNCSVFSLDCVFVTIFTSIYLFAFIQSCSKPSH